MHKLRLADTRRARGGQGVLLRGEGGGVDRLSQTQPAAAVQAGACFAQTTIRTNMMTACPSLSKPVLYYFFSFSPHYVHVLAKR